MIDVAEKKVIEASVGERFTVATLSAVIINFDDEVIEDYVETVNAL